MPSCLRAAAAGAVANDNPQQEWREPPGYLGEAVRRAKRITPAREAAPPRSSQGLPPPA
jgi:hypothetical protein